jgi:hypothetical protein
VLAVRLIGPVEHVLLDGLQELRDGSLEIIDLDLAPCLVLILDVSSGSSDDPLLGILGTEFDAQGQALELPVVELPSRRVALAVIGLDAYTGVFEIIGDLLDFVIKIFLGLGGGPSIC